MVAALRRLHKAIDRIEARNAAYYTYDSVKMTSDTERYLFSGICLEVLREMGLSKGDIILQLEAQEKLNQKGEQHSW